MNWITYGFAMVILAACQTTPRQQQNTSSATKTETHYDSLRRDLATVAASSGGTAGIAVMNLDTRDTLSLNNKPVYPMQSTFKFPIAMAILHLVDEGKWKLDQEIKIDKKWLVKNTYSPLRDDHPEGNITQTLAQLIQYSVSKSDNIACDILIDLAGGESAVNDYIHSLGIQDMHIVANEAKMHAAWDVQFKNACSPTAMIQLLDILNKGTALKKPTNDFLWKTMLETTTGMKRLKGLLPAGTPVAHKTGTSDTKEGITAATNDAGIIVLPNGQKLAVVVFLMNSTANEAAREATIAQIAKLAYYKE